MGVTDPGLVAQEAIYAGLDAMLAAVPLDLCAYLHLPASSGPQLFLRSPDLGTLDPATAFTLFTSLRDAVDREAPQVPGFHAVFVPSTGSASRGLHAVGRRDGALALTAEERGIAEALCRATATIAHMLEPAQQAIEPVRVAVEIQGETIRGEVEVVAAGERFTGKAERNTAHDAVAAAALEAIGGSSALTAAQSVEIAGDHAALVVVESGGTQHVGSALYEPGADPLYAFALAAIQAADRIPRPAR